jgi:Ca2+-transporting ATPase
MLAKQKFEEVLKDLDVNPKTGLTDEEVSSRQEKYGLNELTAKKRVSLIIRFLNEFKDILIIILLIAAVVSVIVDPKEWIESVIILVVVLVNAILGVSQESKAEKSLEALKKLSSPMAKVIRNNKTYLVESSSLVPGDIIVVEAGDYIPADARIIEQSKLQIDESALTGESVAVNKTAVVINLEHISLGDQKNMMFSSTFTTYGRGIAVVTSTGMKTEIGKIANMLNETKVELTPLQVKLNQIGKLIGFIAIGICVVIFLMEWLSGIEGPLEAFKTSVALAVAAIPEGLSTVVTVVLAIGVEKMAKEKAIVKKLPAVETLGSTSIVCSDKTGTLTQNKMTVVKIYRESIKDLESDLESLDQEMLTYFALCSDAKISFVDGVEKRVGDPTETALIEANNKKGLINNNLNEEVKRLADLSFDSDRKMMSVVVNYQGRILSITKGAPDIIIKRSKNNVDKEKVLRVNEEMGSSALRVLGIGIRELKEVPAELESETLETDLQFIGLVGMIDPARKEVKEAIRIAKKAGIKTIMITGDHVVTAKAIAKQLGIIEKDDLAITSEELNKLSDQELFDNIEKYAVYARVAPEDKVRIVKTWQSKGKVVAMTGDGVNDSPALKTADIGCAMGITGTDVAKEAAAMILVDDNFATIITAVREGRGIYKNIKKTVQYLLSSNIGEVLTIFLASIISSFTSLALGVPLLPMHLLWVNLITDSLPAFALGLEATDDSVMDEAPRDKNESFFSHGMGSQIAFQGIAIGLLTLTAYIIGHSINPNTHLGQTMAFFTLSTVQLFHAFNIKSEKSVFSRHSFNNKYLILALLLGIGLQFVILYVPFFATIFKLVSLSFDQLMICLGLAFGIVIFSEIVKLFRKKHKRYIINE